jgi:uncharacterized membrane protein HdeD (DUF308 family)
MDYEYLIAAVGIALIFFGVLYLYQQRRSESDAGHSWLSYIFLWPLLLGADKEKRGDHFLTKREWIGWGVVVLIAVLAIAFTPSSPHQ